MVKVLNIIFGVIITGLTIGVVVLSITTSIFYNQNVTLKTQMNHLSQTVKQLQDEEIRKSEIIQEKEQLLQDLKQAKNWSEICKIWSKL